MRTWRRWGIAMAAATIAVGVMAPMWARAGDRQVTVFDVEGPYEKDLDLGPAGFGPGDTVFEIQPLLDPADGANVGKAYTRLHVMRLLKSGDFVFMIDCQVTLADGTILFAGTARFGDFGTGAVFPVTGGTGAYELARGTVTATFGQLDGKDGATLAFDLTTTA
jgi:hypothetical protein